MPNIKTVKVPASDASASTKVTYHPGNRPNPLPNIHSTPSDQPLFGQKPPKVAKSTSGSWSNATGHTSPSSEVSN